MQEWHQILSSVLLGSGDVMSVVPNYSPAVLLSGGDIKSVVSICSNSSSTILPGGDITCFESVVAISSFDLVIITLLI